MSFRLVPKSVTLNDPERRNGVKLVKTCIPTVHITAPICGRIYARVYCVQCRCKESLRSLSHLLMSFLLPNIYKNSAIAVIAAQSEVLLSSEEGVPVLNTFFLVTQ